MTAAMTSAQRIRDDLSIAVTIIHHTNAGGSRERGHSSMRGAADCMISLTPVDDVIHVECSKQRNGAPFKPMVLKLAPLDGGGCVLRLASDRAAGCWAHNDAIEGADGAPRYLHHNGRDQIGMARRGGRMTIALTAKRALAVTRATANHCHTTASRNLLHKQTVANYCQVTTLTAGH